MRSRAASHRNRWLPVLLAGTCLCGSAAAQQPAEGALLFGAPFPAARYVNLNAAAGGTTTIDLAEYLGKKPLLLYYWMPGNTWSEELFQELEKLSQEFDELAELDLNVPRKKKRSIGLMLALRPWTYWQLLEQRSQQLGPTKPGK